MYYKASAAKLHYDCSQQETKGKSSGALLDSGANGGFGGDNVLVLDWGESKADVTGIDSHKLVDLPIVTCIGLIMTTRGPAIAVMHQYAYHGKGKTIHAPAQLGHFGHDVNEKSVKSPCGTGKQRIITPEGYIIPLDVVDGLPYMPMSKPTEEDRTQLPHIILTDHLDWDPRCMDHTFTETDGEFSDPFGALIDVDRLFEHFDNRFPSTGEILRPDDEYDHHFRDPRGPNFVPDQVTANMSFMGQLQWLISLGRFDVFSAVAPLSIKRTLAIILMFLGFSFIAGDDLTFRNSVKGSNLRLSPAGGENNSHPVSKPVLNTIYEKGRD
jgi:hypothetical protein